MQDSSKPNLPEQQAIDRACDAFEKVWQEGRTPHILDFVHVDLAASTKMELVRELILLDCEYREKVGKLLRESDYRQRLPDFGEAVRRAWLEREKGIPTVIEETLDGSALVAGFDRQSDLVRGERVQYFGDYELQEELARGGMGVVYRAKQLSLNRIIALKMILSGNIAGEEAIRRFQREAEAAANLDHPNIVPIYDIGQHNGQHYFSMKLIEGGTLGSLSDEVKRDHSKIIQLVATVADAVHHAHQRGILHRDLKPANILLDADGQPVITDFGLARNTESDLQLTQTGAIVGTPGFMPPEQASGKGITTAADIYSLGAILYHLLCGRPPHQGDSVMDTLMSVINDPAPKPRELNAKIHPDLELICMKCLAKDPKDRYTSAGEFASDLRALAAGEPLHVRAPTIFELVRMWLANNFGNVLWIPLIALIVGVLAGISVWVCTIGQDLAFYRHTYEKFPSSERSFLAVNWRPLQYPMFAMFVLSLSVIGWLTARMTRTKNRTADLGAGLAVGLLTGLVAFASGMGSVLVESMQRSAKQDTELLFQIAATSNAPTSYAQQRLATRYPTLQSLAPAERASALSMKIAADRHVGSFIGTAIGTLVCLAWFGVLGAGQSYVAGPLRREFSHLRGACYYSCFALALTSVLFVVGSEVTSWVLSGSGYILDWLVPIACTVSGVLVIFAVVARWPWPVLLTATLGWTVAFGFFVELFTSAPVPMVATARTEIKVAQRQLDAEPTRRDYQMRLARAHHEFAVVLREIKNGKYDRRALAEYRAGLAAIERKPIQEFNFEETVLHSALLGDAAALALKLGDPEQAATWSALNTQQYATAPQLETYAQSVLASKRPVTDFLAPTTAKNLNAWYRLAVQLRALATYRDAHGIAGDPNGDPWLQRVIDQVLERTRETAGDTEWPAHRALLKSWLTSRCQWELFGPYPVDPKAADASLNIALGPEESLVSGKGEVAPDKVLSAYAGANVDLLAVLGSGQVDTDLANVAGYARTSFYLSEPKRIRFRLGSDDGLKVWIDGKVLLSNPVERALYEGSDVVDLNEPLSAGWHKLVLKITQGKGDWGFVVNTAQTDNWPLVISPPPKTNESESPSATPTSPTDEDAKPKE